MASSCCSRCARPPRSPPGARLDLLDLPRMKNVSAGRCEPRLRGQRPKRRGPMWSAKHLALRVNIGSYRELCGRAAISVERSKRLESGSLAFLFEGDC